MVLFRDLAERAESSAPKTVISLAWLQIFLFLTGSLNWPGCVARTRERTGGSVPRRIAMPQEAAVLFFPRIAAAKSSSPDGLQPAAAIIRAPRWTGGHLRIRRQ